MLEDRLLIWKIRSGDKAALACVYEKYKNILLKIASGLLRQNSIAEDVVHDVLYYYPPAVQEPVAAGIYLTSACREPHGRTTSSVESRIRNIWLRLRRAGIKYEFSRLSGYV